MLRGGARPADGLYLESRVRAAAGIFYNPRRREEFLGAARTAAAFRHENAAEIFDAFAERGRVFLIAEFVEGRLLDSILASGRPLAPREMKFVIRRLAAVLDLVHARGLRREGWRGKG